MNNINDQDVNGDTPLHAAIKAFDLDNVKYCLQQGADITIKNNLKQSPLHFAFVEQRWTVYDWQNENIQKIIELLKEKTNV